MVQPYIDKFIEKKVDGSKLLILDHLDLDALAVVKFGHQELILEAIDHLRQLVRYFLSSTLNSFSIKLVHVMRYWISDV